MRKRETRNANTEGEEWHRAVGLERIGWGFLEALDSFLTYSKMQIAPQHQENKASKRNCSGSCDMSPRSLSRNEGLILPDVRSGTGGTLPLAVSLL